MLDFKLQDRILRSTWLLGLALTVCTGVGSATAQEAAGSNKPPDQTTVTNGTTRPRQVNADDPLSSLREDIAAAAAPEERARLQFLLVDKLVAANKKEEAVTELHSMAGVDRFDPTAFFNIGNALLRLGDADGAIEAYRKAIDQRKGGYSRALNNLGAALLRQGRWDEAYEALLSALKLEKFRYAEASYNLGRVYTARGQTEMAIREWRRALAVNPQHSGAAAALGNSGRTANGPAPRTSAGGSAPIATGRKVQIDQASFDLIQRARDAHEHGRNEDAIRDYRNVLVRLGGYFAPANLELGFVLANLKRTDEAIAALLPVSTNDGARYPIADYHLGRLFEAKGELKTAAENYSRARTGDGNVQALLDLSRVREKLGDLPGAVTALEEFMRANELGRKPDWIAARLAELRQKIAASAQTSQP